MGFLQALGEVLETISDASSDKFICDTSGQLIRKDAYDTFELTLTIAQARELIALPAAKRKAELERIRIEQSYSNFGRRW